jgi:hypothetical protein
LLAAVIPAPLQQPVTPLSQPVPELPVLRLPTVTAQELLLGTARVDRSGRVHEHTLLGALAWRPGQRVDIATVRDAIIVHAVPTGLHTVCGRGELVLPAAARALCDITVKSVVVLAAAIDQDILVIHPTVTIAGLLWAYYAGTDADHAH